LSDRLVADAVTYTKHNIIDEHPSISGVRTRYPSDQTASNLRLRPHGHRNGRDNELVDQNE